jgi:hypothetical protein
VQSHVDVPSNLDYVRRFRHNEIGFPLLLKNNFPLNNKSIGYLTLGVYTGIQANIKSEIPLKGGWGSWEDIKTIAGYSNDHFFSDIYFDAGCTKSFDWGELSIAPFFKYRINSTWVNTYQKKPNWGFKIIYSFKF